jgi:hypothetical protein
MTRKDKIDKARLEVNKIDSAIEELDVKRTEAFDAYATALNTATDDPEPQVDDVETIRALVEEHGIAQEFDIDDGVKLVQFALFRLSAGKVEPWSCDGCVQFGCQTCARFYNDLYSPITPSGKE